ncbi:unnamed protein product, partial [Mesorhabditis belari]|uniref:Uncharacterized protein n=1 Tax=Mesorhabditis belari TaxID=2138241 RepID=A0AAF3E9D1_9BILA
MDQFFGVVKELITASQPPFRVLPFSKSQIDDTQATSSYFCQEQLRNDEQETIADLPGLSSFSRGKEKLHSEPKQVNRIRTELASDDIKLVNELGRLAPDQLVAYIKNVQNAALNLSLEEKKQFEKGRFLKIFTTQ